MTPKRALASSAHTRFTESALLRYQQQQQQQQPHLQSAFVHTPSPLLAISVHSKDLNKSESTSPTLIVVHPDAHTTDAANDTETKQQGSRPQQHSFGHMSEDENICVPDGPEVMALSSPTSPVSPSSPVVADGKPLPKTNTAQLLHFSTRPPTLQATHMDGDENKKEKSTASVADTGGSATVTTSVSTTDSTSFDTMKVESVNRQLLFESAFGHVQTPSSSAQPVLSHTPSSLSPSPPLPSPVDDHCDDNKNYATIMSPSSQLVSYLPGYIANESSMSRLSVSSQHVAAMSYTNSQLPHGHSASPSIITVRTAAATLSSNHVEEVMRALISVIECLDKASQVCTQLLRHGSFIRFQRTDAFKSFMMGASRSSTTMHL